MVPPKVGLVKGFLAKRGKWELNFFEAKLLSIMNVVNGMVTDPLLISPIFQQIQHFNGSANPSGAGNGNWLGPI